MVCGSLLGAIQIIGATSAQGGPWAAMAGLGTTVALLAALYRLWASTDGVWQSLWGGFLTSACYFGTALHWLGKSANPDPETFVIREAVTTFGAMWLFIPWWMLWFATARLIAPARSRTPASIAAFVGAFSAANLMLGDFAMGIPMAPLSLAALDTPAAALFSIIGQFGLDTALVGLGAVSGFLATRSRVVMLVSMFAGLAIVGSTLQPAATIVPSIPTGGRPIIYLAQPALSHPSLLHPDEVTGIYLAEMKRQIAHGVEADAEIIVLPEGAFFQDLTAEAALVDELRSSLPVGTQLLAGFPRIELDPETFVARPFNSVMILNRGGPLFVYDKSHLVPFGETMPAIFFRLGFDVLAGPSGGYGKGDGLTTYQPSMTVPPFALLICYEIMVSGAVSREIEGAEWLLNLSSEALFRGTIGPEIILAQVRIRALETGLPVLRSTAHAYSGLILPDGSDLSMLDPEVSGGIALELPAAQPTLFYRLGGLAYAPLYALTLFILGFSLAFRLKSRRTDMLRNNGLIRSLK